MTVAHPRENLMAPGLARRWPTRSLVRRRRLLTAALAVVAAAALAACSSPTEDDTRAATNGMPNIRQQLTANVWVLDADASSLQARTPRAVTAAFSAAGVVSGMAACNRYTGNYTLSFSTIRITHISQTAQACPAGALAAEAEYLRSLRAVRYVEPSSRDRLKLTAGHNVRLAYDANGPT
jgi:heat shock protein HslJ